VGHWIGFLSRFSEFQAFRQPSGSGEGVVTVPSPAAVVEPTPDEQIRAGYKRLRESLGGQLLERVKAVSPASFERLVIYVQAKRWQSTVGRPEIQRFACALLGQRARKGIFITTSGFSADAIAYAANQQVSIVLIDGRTLAELMMDAQIGVSTSEQIRVLKQDEDISRRWKRADDGA